MAIKEGGNNAAGAHEAVRAPLIKKKNQSVEEDGSVERNTSKESVSMVYLSTFVAVCGAYEFGQCVGYSSPTQDGIIQELSLSIAEYSLFGSILTFGAIIGSITCGPVADWVGLKGAMRVASGFCIAGWLAIYVAKGPSWLGIGRLATGFGIGVVSYVVPVFIAEIAPKKLRGGLIATNQLMICAGASVSFIIGAVITWRVLALTGLVPCAFVLFGLLLIPESPRWLAKIGHEEEFEAALQKLRGKDADISEEAAEIKDYIETLEQLPKAKLLDLFQRRYLRSVFIGIGLMVFQQFGGINGVSFYASKLWSQQVRFSPSVGTITYAILQVVVTALITTVIDKVGRKPLLLVSVSGLVLACIITAVSFYMKVHELAIKAVPALTTTGILVYIGSFSVGMGAIPWVIMSEIFPVNIKGAAGSLATLVNWLGAWAVSYTYNFLMSWSSYGTYILYAAVNALAMVFAISFVPETKGRTLEQIQAAINRDTEKE